MQLIPASEIRVARACAVLAALGMSGAAVLALHPAGQGLNGRVLPLEQILNGLLLAAAGPAAVVSAYWPVMWRTVEPYGLSTMRRIGSVWLIVIVALSTLAPASLLARGEITAGLSACLFATLLWGLFIEGQRRRRRELTGDAWTDPTLDALRLHREVLAVGALGIASALLLDAAVDDIVLSDLVAGVIWLSCVGLYAGVVARGAPRLRVAQAIALIYGVASFALYDLPAPEARFVVLGIGAPLVALVLEVSRRRAIRQRVRELCEEGQGEQLRHRYPELVHS
jgi:hypothetical protein